MKLGRIKTAVLVAALGLLTLSGPAQAAAQTSQPTSCTGNTLCEHLSANGTYIYYQQIWIQIPAGQLWCGGYYLGYQYQGHNTYTGANADACVNGTFFAATGLQNYNLPNYSYMFVYVYTRAGYYNPSSNWVWMQVHT